MSDRYNSVVNETVISTAGQLPTVVSGFHVWESGTYRIDGAISSAYGHKRADGAQVYIYGKSLQGDTLTYTGGADGTFTTASDPGGGKTQINLADTTGFADGDIVFLPKTSVYSQNQRYTISGLVTNTSFEIDTAYIATDAGPFYKGQMWIDDETATGQENALLRIENIGLFINGGGRLLDFPDGGNTRGTMWFFGCFIVGDASNYCELGIVDNYNFFTMSSIPICIGWDDGVCLNDINQTIINSQMTAWKDNDGTLVCTGTGTFGLFSIGGAGSIVQPASSEAVLYLNPGGTYTNQVTITGVVNTGTFFESGSLDNTSEYIKVTNVGGVPNSAVAAQVDTGPNTLTTTNNAALSWNLINSDQWAASELERVSVDASGVATYDGIDDIVLPMNFSVSIEPSSGTNKDMRVRIVKIGTGSRTVTFTNGTNLINEVATPRADNDTVSFYDTAGTLPAELSEGIVYYVVNKSTDSFQVSYTEGGAAVAFTDDGTPTNSYKATILNGILASANVDSGDPKSLTRFGLISVENGDKFAMVVQNATDSNNIDITSGGYIVVK